MTPLFRKTPTLKALLRDMPPLPQWPRGEVTKRLGPPIQDWVDDDGDTVVQWAIGKPCMIANLCWSGDGRFLGGTIYTDPDHGHRVDVAGFMGSDQYA